MDSDLKSKFLKGSVAAAAGTISSMVFHFASIMILTRRLSKEEFGIYILMMVLVNFLTIVSGLGLNTTLVKFISTEKHDENRSAFRAVMVIRAVHLTLLSIVFYAVSNYLLSFFDSRLYYFRAWIPILFILTSYRDIFFNLLQGLNLYKKYAFVQTVSAAFRVFMIVTFVHFNILSLHHLSPPTGHSTFLVKRLHDPRPEPIHYKNNRIGSLPGTGLVFRSWPEKAALPFF